MFHWKNGWYFGRLPDGDVVIMNANFGGFKLIIDKDSWPSIVAGVSKNADSAESYQEAVRLHEGKIACNT